MIQTKKKACFLQASIQASRVRAIATRINQQRKEGQRDPNNPPFKRNVFLPRISIQAKEIQIQEKKNRGNVSKKREESSI